MAKKQTILLVDVSILMHVTHMRNCLMSITSMRMVKSYGCVNISGPSCSKHR